MSAKTIATATAGARPGPYDEVISVHSTPAPSRSSSPINTPVRAPPPPGRCIPRSSATTPRTTPPRTTPPRTTPPANYAPENNAPENDALPLLGGHCGVDCRLESVSMSELKRRGSVHIKCISGVGLLERLPNAHVAKLSVQAAKHRKVAELIEDAKRHILDIHVYSGRQIDIRDRCLASIDTAAASLPPLSRLNIEADLRGIVDDLQRQLEVSEGEYAAALGFDVDDLESDSGQSSGADSAAIAAEALAAAEASQAAALAQAAAAEAAEAAREAEQQRAARWAVPPAPHELADLEATWAMLDSQAGADPSAHPTDAAGQHRRAVAWCRRLLEHARQLARSLDRPNTTVAGVDGSVCGSRADKTAKLG